MRGRGAALLIGMRAGEARAEAAQQQQQQSQAAQQAAYQQGKQEAQTAKPAASSGGDLTAQLDNLSKMHAAGQLSDEEYAAAKKKLLG
jgi:hypothetical protein